MGGTSIYIGVKNNGSKEHPWVAYFQQKHLGSYAKETDAAYPYDYAVRLAFGDQGKVNGVAPVLNFIPYIAQVYKDPFGNELPPHISYYKRKDSELAYYRVQWYFNQKPHSLSCIDLSSALNELNRLKEEFAKFKSIKSEVTIVRNDEGIAYIALGGSYSHLQVLVDDNQWRKMSQSRWSYSGGYASNGKLMHRIIISALPDTIVDHINGNPLDNRIVNLRIVTPSENAQNKRKRPSSEGIYIGVRRNRGSKTWSVRISCEDVITYLGSYQNEQIAAWVYNEKAKQLYPGTPRLNNVAVPAGWKFIDDRGIEGDEKTARISNQTSDFRGVARTPEGKYVAKTFKDGVRYYLGVYDDEPFAAWVYDQKQLELNPDVKQNKLNNITASENWRFQNDRGFIDDELYCIKRQKLCSTESINI